MILEEKVSELEEMLQKLAYMQMNTQMNIDKLSREMKKNIDSLSREMKTNIGSLSQEIKEFKNHTQHTVDRLEEKLKKDTEEMKKEMNRQWEKMVKKLGTLVEDIVAPSITYIGEKYFNCNEPLDFGVRRWKVKPGDPSQGREFDVIAVYKDKIIVNETKSNPCDISEVNKFINLIKDEIFEYFPEYKDKEVIPVFASLYIPEHIKTYLTQNRIYAIGMKEDTMDILNSELLQEK